MPETQTLEQPTFPKRGRDYEPLPRGKKNGRIVAHAVQTIAAEPEQVFNVYSRIELLPTWQEGVVSVESNGEDKLHWVMQDPGTGKQTEFNSEIVEAVPGKRHMSRIVDGPAATSTITLNLEPHPAGRGTIVTLVGDYQIPGSIIGNAIAAVISRSPEQITIENLRHLKELIESGQIPSVEGQPAGPRGIMGTWKRFLMGENLPTPPGTSDRARPQDMPEHDGHDNRALVMGGVAAIAGAAAWYGIRKLTK